MGKKCWELWPHIFPCTLPQWPIQELVKGGAQNICLCFAVFFHQMFNNKNIENYICNI